ncbi:MAG: ProQ/FinO family protein [Candidatus Competibacteraceae bacterium]|nr:ProQ/FinO family protein [Candidatus Competibacteraceae bacterium]
MSATDKRAVQAVHALLRERFPKAFPSDYDAIKPLAIGIQDALRQRLPEVDVDLLRRALANHTQRDGYLLALIHGRGDRRYDLDGRPVGTVTPEERAQAQQRLAASQQRQQAQAQRRRDEKAREEKRRLLLNDTAPTEIDTVARHAALASLWNYSAARKAALIAQGITPESRSERKRRLAREAAERATRKAQRPRPPAERPADSRPTVSPSRKDWPLAPPPDQAKSMPKVTYRKKRRIAPPDAP